MGLTSRLGRLLGRRTTRGSDDPLAYGVRSSDDAASGADDAARGNDEFVDSNVQQARNELSGGYRVIRDVGETAASQPANAVRGLADTAMRGTVGLAGVGGATIVGMKGVNWARAQDEMENRQNRQEALEWYRQQIEAIENNENMTEEEKEAAKERLQQMWEDTWGKEDEGGSSMIPGLDALMSALGLNGTGGGGILNKLIIGMAVVTGIKYLPGMIQSLKG